ncbi:MAG: sugar nucleotide-binding protein [Halobacteriovoraceae bacterium]|nr:sugar nucleotide-binding protein [Halobacteriovoraceae bacterium]
MKENNVIDGNFQKPFANQKTVLIFGISSFVGSNIAQFLKYDYKVAGTYHTNHVEIPGVFTFPCDVLNKDAVQLALYETKPDIAIYCAGLSSTVDCSKAPELADALNTIGLFNVNEYCQRYKSRVCFLSTAYVFGGENKIYKEMDIPDPNTIFGKTKSSAEFYIQKSSLNYLILRCCNLYGRSYVQNQENWFECIQRQLFEGETVQADDFLHTGFLDVNYLSMVLRLCIERNVSNRLLQVTSTDVMTHYHFAKKYTEIFKDSGEKISKGRWTYPILDSTGITLTSGPSYYQLGTQNIEGGLHVKMPSIEESLNFTFRRFHGKGLDPKKGETSSELKFI